MHDNGGVMVIVLREYDIRHILAKVYAYVDKALYVETYGETIYSDRVVLPYSRDTVAVTAIEHAIEGVYRFGLFRSLEDKVLQNSIDMRYKTSSIIDDIEMDIYETLGVFLATELPVKVTVTGNKVHAIW